MISLVLVTTLDHQGKVEAQPLQRHAPAAVLVLISLLASIPFLTPFHRYPITSFDSEWIAAVALASAMIVAGLANGARVSLNWPLPSIAVGLLAIGAVHYVTGMLHYTYTWSSLFIFMCAMCAAYLLGRWVVAADLRTRGMQAICAGLLIGGLLSVVVQLLQVSDVRALPDWLVFSMVDRLSNRRPFANLGQPNHLATYLAAATIAALYLARHGTRKRLLLAAAGTLFCGLALTGSRMGSLLGLLVVGFVLMPNAVSPPSRRDRVQIAIVLVGGYAIGLLAARLLLVDTSGVMINALERYGEGSFGQRVSMWSDALRIALAHPWLGVGAGEYGWAQYLFAEPHPAILPTNNPHNFVLHIAAEFGVPAAAFTLAAICWWCWQRMSAWNDDAEVATALMLILIVLAHSLLEYPLWNLYFLIVVAMLAGIAEPAGTGIARTLRARFILFPLGIIFLGGAAAMKADYERIVPIWDSYLSDVYNARQHAPETTRAVIGSINETYFKPQMERLYVELIPAAEQRGDENLALAARVLTRLADMRVMVRYIELLVQAGRIEETYQQIARLKIFAGSDYPILKTEIEESVAKDAVVPDAFRRALTEP
jgi:hypothetical protein